MTPEKFIARWRNNPLTERAGAQTHFDDLCELLGIDKPRDLDRRYSTIALSRFNSRSDAAMRLCLLNKRKLRFAELPPSSRYRADYLDDEGFRSLQNELLADPEAGDVIEGTGRLRKLRHGDRRRGKGKRGGLRVIYFWWQARCISGFSRCTTRTN